MFHLDRTHGVANAVIIGILLLYSMLLAGDQWQVFTDKRDVREILVVNNTLWCATSGGLVAFDIVEESFREFTTADGLSGIGISSIATDGSNGLWLAFDNHSLQLFDLNQGVMYEVPALEMDEKLTKLNDIVVDERGVYLATNSGIAKIVYLPDLDRWVWLEQYTNLGSFPLETEVHSLKISNDYLWAGTNSGMARGDLNANSLLSWENFNRFDGLPEDTIRDIAIFDGVPYAATSGGIASFGGTTWSSVGSLDKVSRLEVSGDSLRAITLRQIYTWTGSSWVRSVQTSNWITSVSYSHGELWAGLVRNSVSLGGLLKVTATEEFSFLPNGPITNSINSFAFTDHGDVILIGGQRGGEYGLSVMRGTEWTVLSSPTNSRGVFSYSSRDVAIDFDGGIWVGSFGGGLARFTETGEVFAYDTTDSRLAAISMAPTSNYVATPGVVTDEAGNLWVVNRSAQNGKILVCIPRGYIQNPSAGQEWYYFHRSLFRNYGDLEFIEIDGRGRKWLGSGDPTPSVSAKGIYVFDDNGTIDNPADDWVWGPITGLNLQEINSITYDPAGYIWVGSLDGAYYINSETDNPDNQRFTQIYQLRQQSVNAITIDNSGNKWFATNDGIMVMGPDLFTIKQLITPDPPSLLPDGPVQAIAINPVTGWAFLGTNKGTAALQTPYKDFGDDIKGVSVSDNPFNPNLGKMYFSGTSLAGGASVRIYTADGRLVRILSYEEAALGWDGRDDSGNDVADAVYLLLTHSANGQSGQGKVAVIRR